MDRTGYAGLAVAGLTAVAIALYVIGVPSIFGRDRDIRFMTAEQTAAFIRADKDRFMNSLTFPDLFARMPGVTSHSIDAYKEAAAVSAAAYSQNTQMRILAAATTIDAISGLASLKSIPWVFALTHGTAYENGLPHTRGSVIFLSSESIPDDESALVSLLIHERIHIFQRLYPDETAEWVRTHGYKRRMLRKFYLQSQPLLRSNPDLDDWVYEENDGRLMVAAYDSSTPKYIGDISDDTGGSHEHPYEAMAYQVSKNRNLSL